MKIIAANWKMNKTNKEAKLFFAQYGKLVRKPKNQVMFFVPFTALQNLPNTVMPGAQNFHPAKSGAFTGEISLEQLAEMGVRVVLAGHSERRALFGETDQFIREKVKSALNLNLKVILCIGETLKERQKKKTEAALKRQLENISPHKDLCIAYEPVWAIGTGLTPTPEQIKQTHAYIKSLVNVAVLYGGGVNEKNCKEILSIPNVDGVLVGTASLAPDKFAAVVNCNE